MPRIAYVNGCYLPHIGARVSVEDRGFQFADGAYEVIAYINGRFADERGHLDRLWRSLHELRISLPLSRHALRLVMREVMRRNRLLNAALYIQVTRGVAPRDFRFPACAPPSLVMTVRPASFDLALRKNIAKKAVTVPDLRWKRRDIKTTALVAQVLAKQAAHDRGADEAILVDDKGFVTEGSSTNVWIITKSGVLMTRPVDHNMILKGVTLSAIKALCHREKIKLAERAFTVKDLRAAREVFTTAAVSLITPIVSVDGQKIGDGRPGKLTIQILENYMHYAAGGARQERWVYP